MLSDTVEDESLLVSRSSFPGHIGLWDVSIRLPQQRRKERQSSRINGIEHDDERG